MSFDSLASKIGQLERDLHDAEVAAAHAAIDEGLVKAKSVIRQAVRRKMAPELAEWRRKERRMGLALEELGG